jgi:hypothetical protein
MIRSDDWPYFHPSFTILLNSKEKEVTMKQGMRFWKIGMALLLVAVLAGGAEAANFTRLNPIMYREINTVLQQYLSNNINLNQNVTIGNMQVYWNQRMVGNAINAIVEGAHTIVQFNPELSQYEELQSLRPDVVDGLILPPVMTSTDVANLVSGFFLKADLYILDPNSAVFPVTSDPTHPSWVVYSSLGLNPDGTKNLLISIFDSVNGNLLGYGTPPPTYTALSIDGPEWGATSPCNGIWHDWMMSAKNGYDAMGYSTEGIDVATSAQIQGHIQSSTTALFYELDHGGSYNFHNICPDSGRIYGSDIGAWISGYTKMPFAFIGSCEGLCENGPGTFSYEFRKNDTAGTTAVGYCHMDWSGLTGEDYDCTQCWNNSIAWQDDLFDRLKNGETVKDAFDHALADYPMCGNGSTCMRLDGDQNLKLVPVVMRGSLPTAEAGSNQTVEQTNAAGTSVTLDGSASSSPNAATLTYAWSWSGGSATGVNPTASFPLGTTAVTLTVDDGFGSPLDVTQRSDKVYITVEDTTKPVFTIVPATVTVEQTSASGTPVTLPPATATDICDANPTITSNAPAVFPLGTTTVTFTATDHSGNKATATTTVTVQDTTPPVLKVPAAVSVEQTNRAGTPYALPPATATDICDANPTITSNAPAVFPLGTTTVTFTATDHSGNSTSGTTTVTVRDTTPPDITNVNANPSILWPPNHKMVPVTVAVSVTDICDAAPKCRIVAVGSNEPENGLGDGDTAPDWVIKGDFNLNIRSERSGTGSGRVYTITVQCTDFSGNSATKDVKVTVPHNM